MLFVGALATFSQGVTAAAELREVELADLDLGANQEVGVFMSTNSVEVNQASMLLEELELGRKNDLRFENAIRLPRGLGTQYTFTQTYDGIPVWNSQVVIKHLENEPVFSATANVAYGMPEAKQVEPAAFQDFDEIIELTKSRYLEENLLTEVGTPTDTQLEIEQGRYVLLPVDEAPDLTEDQEAGLEAALASVRSGKGASLEDVRAKLKPHVE